MANVGAARRREATGPPPPIKPKPKLSSSTTYPTCQNLDNTNLDIYDNPKISNHPITNNVKYANSDSNSNPSITDDDVSRSLPVTGQSRSCSMEPEVSKNGPPINIDNHVIRGVTVPSSLLPVGTVKALAEKFGGSSRNLHNLSNVTSLYKKQPSRKVSFKHRTVPICHNTAKMAQSFSGTDPCTPNLHKQPNLHIGFLINGSRRRSSLNWSTQTLNRFLYANRLSQRKRRRRNRAHMQDLDNHMKNYDNNFSKNCGNHGNQLKKSFSNDDVIISQSLSEDCDSGQTMSMSLSRDQDDESSGLATFSSSSMTKSISTVENREQNDDIFYGEKFEILRLSRSDDSNLLNFIGGTTAAKYSFRRKSAPISSSLSPKKTTPPPKIPPKPKILLITNRACASYQDSINNNQIYNEGTVSIASNTSKNLDTVLENSPNNDPLVEDRTVPNGVHQGEMLLLNNSSLEISCHIYSIADYVDENHMICSQSCDNDVIDHVTDDVTDDNDYDTISGSPKKRAVPRPNDATRTSTPDHTKSSSRLKSDRADHTASPGSTYPSKNSGQTDKNVSRDAKRRSAGSCAPDEHLQHANRDSSFDTVASISSDPVEPSANVPDPDPDPDHGAGPDLTSGLNKDQSFYVEENFYEEVIYDNPDELKQEVNNRLMATNGNQSASSWETTSSATSATTASSYALTSRSSINNENGNFRRRSSSHDISILGHNETIQQRASLASHHVSQTLPQNLRPPQQLSITTLRNDMLTESDLPHSTTTPTLDSPSDLGDNPENDQDGQSSQKKNRLPRHMRPKSQTIDFDKLFRFKSDIRVNFSQAVGKIKLKVSSGRGNRDKKTKSTFYLPVSSSVDGSNGATPADDHGAPMGGGSSISITLETPVVPVARLPSESGRLSRDDDASSSLSAEIWEPTGGRGPEIGGGESLFDDVMKATGLCDSAAVVVTGSSSSSSVAPNRLPDLVQHEVIPIRHSISSPGHNSSMGNGTAEIDFNYGSNLIPSPDDPNGDSSANNLTDPERFEMIYSSRFAFSEPLYQHYRSDTLTTLGVQRNQTFGEADNRGTRREKLLNSSQLGSQRTLWCELPEVQEAGLLNQLKDDERKLQEAMFEVITSEASYLRSLNILITHFMACPKLSGNVALGSVIHRQERKRLFSNILAIRDCSENLLCQLESRLEQNVVLDDICDLLMEHLCKFYDVYVKYCSNQLYQERTLNSLRNTNVHFCHVLNELESSQICESLNLRSFLMLPMQRITRYPLLIGAILSRTQDKAGKSHMSREKAFNIASKVVKECNEGAKKFERLEQLVELEKHLVYKEGGPKRLALISENRWLVKQGSVIELESRRKSSLGSKPYLRKLHLLLFTDLLVVTKKLTTTSEISTAHDGKWSFSVRDYCPRQFVAAEPLEPGSCRVPGTPSGASSSSGGQSGTASKLFSLTLMTNHRGKQSELILLAESESERAHWLKLLCPATNESDGAGPDEDDEGEKIYETWDCPQAKVIEPYEAKEGDELQLEFDETVNILRKCPDGWFYGERLRDSRTGWFPGSCTEEILSDHVRAKHYRQRLKLIHEAEIQIQLQHQQQQQGSKNTGTLRRNSAVKSIFGF